MQTDFPPNYTSQNPYSRKLVIGGAVLVLILVGALIVFKRINQDATLTLKSAPGYTISVGTPSDGENGLGIAKVLVKTSSSTNIRLKKGQYIASFARNNDYISAYQNVGLTHDVTLTPLALNYTAAKLNSLLAQQTAAIHAAFQASSSGPLLLSGYTVQDMGLYDDGNWYVGRLTPTNTARDDILVFIMQRQSTQWKLVAAPAITLYIGGYPNIPANIIRAANVSPIGSSLPY
jgi:hypothetical protein